MSGQGEEYQFVQKSALKLKGVSDHSIKKQVKIPYKYFDCHKNFLDIKGNSDNVFSRFNLGRRRKSPRRTLDPTESPVRRAGELHPPQLRVHLELLDHQSPSNTTRRKRPRKSPFSRGKKKG